MTFTDIKDSQKIEFNQNVSHPLQSFEWGNFRQKTQVKVIRQCVESNNKLSSCFQITIHKIPHSKFTIGYLPKGYLPDSDLLSQIRKLGKKENCIFIQLEPNIEKAQGEKVMKKFMDDKNYNLVKSFHPLFTPYTFLIDLTKTEQDLLKNMHPKTRYNIKIANKHQVIIKEDDSQQSFMEYLKLTKQTSLRQGFYAHDDNYHELMWDTLKKTESKQGLRAHLFLAKYKNHDNKLHTLAAWVLFVFNQKLYYPYGASSNEYKQTMASNLLMWEAIKFGKRLNLKEFDLWGSLGPDPDIHDPWYGFHRFKQGYGGKLQEFVSSYDLIINPKAYTLYKIINACRWFILKLERKLKAIEYKA